MNKHFLLFLILSVGFTISLSFTMVSAAKTTTALYPDLRTVVPDHLQIANDHQREFLRFSNAIADTGDGPWQMKPVFPLGSDLTTQDAIQQILDVNGNVVKEVLVSQFQFHPEHNHWHIGDVALFSVHAGSPTGPILPGTSVKSTFCLIDWIKLDNNSKTPERTYFYCNGNLQGVSVGWADQYHQSTEGQEIDITGATPGLYFLVSKVNYKGTFVEKDLNNNEAWTSFLLSRDSNGNAKIAIFGHSPCDSPGLCAQFSANR